MDNSTIEEQQPSTTETPNIEPEAKDKNRRFLGIVLLLSAAVVSLILIILFWYGQEASLAFGLVKPKDPWGGTLALSSSSTQLQQRHWLPTRLLIHSAPFFIPILLVMVIVAVSALVAIRQSGVKSNWVIMEGGDGDENVSWWDTLWRVLRPPRIRAPPSEKIKELMQQNVNMEKILLIVGAVGSGILLVFIAAVLRYLQTRLSATDSNVTDPIEPVDNAMTTSPSIRSLYHLDKVLGSGGFGQVWLGRSIYDIPGIPSDQQPSRVAIKLILSEKRERLIEKRRAKLLKKKEEADKVNKLDPKQQQQDRVEPDKLEQKKKEEEEPKASEQEPEKVIIKAQDIDKTRLLLRNEAQVLKTLNHPNIIKFYDYLPRQGHAMFQDEEALVTEYVERSLSSLDLGSVWTTDTNGKFVHIAKQLFTVLHYLHDTIGKKHLDLKPDNIMYTSTIDNPLLIKLIDFGMCVKKENTVGYCGTYNFMAPELVKKNGTSSDEKPDIWSAGMTLIALFNPRKSSAVWKVDEKKRTELTKEKVKKLTEKMVKENKLDGVKAEEMNSEQKEKMKEIEREAKKEAGKEANRLVTQEAILAFKPEDPKTYPYMETVPEPFQKFIMRCLVPDPSKRPTARELLEDDIFKS